MKPAFEAKNVHKHFGHTKALDGVTLQAAQGKIFGLLGPNGAGKTTLVRMLSTLLDPDQGTAKVLGIDVTKEPDKVRRLIGLAGQFAAVDEYLTGMENIYMVGRLYHLPAREARARAQKLLEDLHLAEAANRPVKTYSGGMRRRLDLGASLVGRPKILFLDEPTTGLDPRTRLDLWAIIRELVAEGTSILLTTQYLEEADELADMIAVIDRGKVIAEGTSNQLKTRLGGDVVELELHNIRDAEKIMSLVAPLAKKPPVLDSEGLSITVPVTNGSKTLLAIIRELDTAKLEVSAVSLHRPSLDDVFLSLTGEKASAVAAPGKVAKRGGKR